MRLSMNYYQPLWSHQEHVVELCSHLDNYGLFHEMGTGKTFSAINIYRQKCVQHKTVLPLLVLCPLIVVENWRREFEKAAHPNIVSKVQLLTGDSHKRLRQLKTEGKEIFITNHDILNTKMWFEILARHHKKPFRMLIVDESHRFKGPTTKRTKRLIYFADTVKYKLILTGTPILNDCMDIWSQFRVLDKNIFPENFYVFRAKYFEDTNNRWKHKQKYFPKWEPKTGTKAELNEIIGQHSHRVLKSEVLDLPELIRQEASIELLPLQQKHYKEMADSFITYLNDDAITADIALTKILRLQQIIVGILKTENDEVKRVPSAKLEALKELLEDLYREGQLNKPKTIIWTNFIDTYKDIESLCNNLKLTNRRLIGGQSLKERQQHIDEFNTLDIPIMIANQSAGGVGVGLQAASYAIYYSKTFNLGDDIQSESRNHRSGSEIHGKITRIDIIAKDTVDEQINEALEKKLKLGELLLRIKEVHGIRRKTNE
jgi:SNF2 family DNA or RNA helicase